MTETNSQRQRLQHKMPPDNTAVDPWESTRDRQVSIPVGPARRAVKPLGVTILVTSGLLWTIRADGRAAQRVELLKLADY